MGRDIYRELLGVMRKRGGEYAGADVPEFFEMAEALFTAREAEVNNAMPRDLFTAVDMAQQLGGDEKEIEKTLEGMADKGLTVAVEVEGTRFYQAVPFMPGIFEFQFMPGKTTEKDRKLARLIYAYKKAYEKENDPSVMTFPSKRVITVDRMVEPGNQIHTYDQVQGFVDENDTISVTTCYCRHAAALRDEDTHEMPTEVCLQFGIGARFAIEKLGGRELTRGEAREVLDRSEEAGLIHMSQNMTEDVPFICNCDRWHCSTVLSALAKPKPALFFNSGFEPRFDTDKCKACETCIGRCPPGALTMGGDGVLEVNLDRCFGCAVCATGCPQEAIGMVSKPVFPEPPKDTGALRDVLTAHTAQQ